MKLVMLKILLLVGRRCTLNEKYILVEFPWSAARKWKNNLVYTTRLALVLEIKLPLAGM